MSAIHNKTSNSENKNPLFSNPDVLGSVMDYLPPGAKNIAGKVSLSFELALYESILRQREENHGVACITVDDVVGIIREQNKINLEGHQGEVKAVSFSRDGSKIASASTSKESHDGVIKIWDLGTQECIETILGSTSEVKSVSLSPDGCKLASVDKDGIKIWDVSNNISDITRAERVQIIPNNMWEFTIRGVRFTPDGKQIIGLSDCDLRTWGLRPFYRIWDVNINNHEVIESPKKKKKRRTFSV